MLTFQKVLETFKDFLASHEVIEVVKISKGYIVLDWGDSVEGSASGEFGFESIDHCRTPEELLDRLTDSYKSFLSSDITKGQRDLTEQEEKAIDEEGDVFRKTAYTVTTGY